MSKYNNRTKDQGYRYSKPQGGVVDAVLRSPSVEVEGTCEKCKQKVFLQVPLEVSLSFQGCNRVKCPRCYPHLNTHWYFKEEVKQSL